MHHVEQLLGVSEEDQTLLPLHSPFVAPLCFWQVIHAVGRAGWGCKADPVAACRGNVAETLCTQLPVLHARWEEARHGSRRHRRSISLVCCRGSTALAASPAQVSLRLCPAAVAGQQFWHFSPALVRVAARWGCCWWVRDTAASLQRLKTHFQRATGAGVGISLPWHGQKASLAAACWGSCGWRGGGDCLHAFAYCLENSVCQLKINGINPPVPIPVVESLHTEAWGRPALGMWCGREVVAHVATVGEVLKLRQW